MSEVKETGSQIEKRPIIAVWFSCGAASAMAAKLTLDKYRDTHDVMIVNNPVDEEGEDNIRFKEDVSKWLNHEILTARNPLYNTTSAVVIWDEAKYMCGLKGAPCTVKLKKEARYAFEKKYLIAHHVLGFTVEEKHRHKRFVEGERLNTLPILIEAGYTKEMCLQEIQDAGIQLPEAYRLGMPNANCYGCVKATSPTYWNLIRKIRPDVFQKRLEQSYKLGARLVRYKGKRIFLHELPEDATGRKIKSFECGIFCDSK